MNKQINAPPFKISLKKAAGKAMDVLPKFHCDTGSVRILIYHNISDGYTGGEWAQMTTPAELFDRQMRYLKENQYNIISANEILKILASEEVPPKTVCITFDDGYRDNYKNAFPILTRYGLKATIFITTGFIASDHTYLNWDEIKEMKRSGMVTFGCHSDSHPCLTSLDDAELGKEIIGAKKIMEDKLEEIVDLYAYPFGWFNSFNVNVIDAVRKSGFKAGFTGIYGANTQHTDHFQLRRIRISWLEDIDEFAMILRGSYDWYSIYQRMHYIWKKLYLTAA